MTPPARSTTRSWWRRNRRHGDGGAAGGDRAQGRVLRAVQRSGEPFFLTPKAGGKVDPATADAGGAGAAGVGDADDPGLLAAGAGRSERSFGTWQGRLPQELRLARISDAGGGEPVSAGTIHRRVQPPFSGCGRRSAGTPFCRCRSRDLERIFSLQFERSVNRDNTVSFQNLSLQIERVRWRATWRVARWWCTNI